MISYYDQIAVEQANEAGIIFSRADVESYREERKIPLSIEFHTKIIEETKNLLFWFKEHKSCYGKWMIVNGEVFDVEWEK